MCCKRDVFFLGLDNENLQQYIVISSYHAAVLRELVVIKNIAQN
jgi:hypothetical protein